MENKKVLYEELLPGEFVERLNDFPVAYLPLGTLEWHGLHLPLGADGLQAQGIFARLASAIGGIVLPMLFLGPDSAVEENGVPYYGMDYKSFTDGEPQLLEGSAYYIEDEQFNALLDTILANLARAGFKVVVGHGHGPSTHAFTARKQIFHGKFGLDCYNLWELAHKGEQGIQTDHAATNETSLVMALRPELVQMENLAAGSTPVGVWGVDPRQGASAALGKELIEANIRLASQNLTTIVSKISATKRNLDYENVKSLLAE